jgi:hypothetical protein
MVVYRTLIEGPGRGGAVDHLNPQTIEEDADRGDDDDDDDDDDDRGRGRDRDDDDD